MNWTYTLLHYPMNMVRSRSIVHVLMYVKLVRNSSCTAIHCMYLLLHVIGKERGRKRGRERGREREGGREGEREGRREGGRDGETEIANMAILLLCCDWFFD